MIRRPPRSTPFPTRRSSDLRFSGQSSDLMQRINASIGFDKRLWREDIAGSKAHAAMLGAQGIIPAEDADAILKGLDRKSKRLNSSHANISYAVFCFEKKKNN